MAWALQFDGVNDYGIMLSTLDVSGDYTIVIDAVYLTSHQKGALLGESSYSGNSWIGDALNINEYNLAETTRGVGVKIIFTPTIGTVFTLTASTIGSVATIDINGTSVSSTITSPSGLSRFKEIGRTEGGFYTNAAIMSVKVYDSASLLINNWDATASSHAAGTPILTDTVGGNNITGVNMRTDGGAWINLGGGGTTLAIDSLVNNQTTEGINLLQHNMLQVANLNCSQSINQIILKQAAILTIDSLVNSQTTNGIILDIASLLSLNDSTMNQTISQIIVSAVGSPKLSLATIANSSSLEDITLSQHNLVAIDNLTISQLIAATNFNGIVVGYFKGAPSIFYPYNNKIRILNALTGKIRIAKGLNTHG